MPWNPNNPSQRLQQQAQQQQQRMHRHFRQFAAKQQKGLMDQWRARQAHQAAQIGARQQQQHDASPQPANVPRYRDGWSSGPDDQAGSGIPSLQGVPHQGSGAGGVFVGEARNIERTTEQGGLNYQRTFQVLTFRVDRRDSAGNLQQSVPVRLRGQRIVGNVREGEWVGVKGQPGRDGMIQVGSFWNMATQSNVTSGGLFIFRWGGGSGLGAAPAGAARLGQFFALIGAIVFTASVTVLTGYVDNGTGSKSLLQATNGDLASPLYPKDFWILIGLATLAFVTTVMSMRMYKRSLMICATAASAGLIGYTLHIPQIGLLPGFGPYGSAYWLSLVAAIAMALGAGAAAVARSAP
jgi:hypothetical protein